MASPITLITTADVGATLNVSEQTVRTWCRLGVIPATRPTGTRKWLIIEQDFLSWLQDGAGQRVTSFLDPAHRSTASEAELLADAEAALARINHAGTPKRKKGRGPALKSKLATSSA